MFFHLCMFVLKIHPILCRRPVSICRCINYRLCATLLTLPATAVLFSLNTRGVGRARLSPLAKNVSPPAASSCSASCMSLLHGDRPDEVQIVVANSELAIERGDFDKALLILGNVPPESPAYVRVQVSCGPSKNKFLSVKKTDRGSEKMFSYTKRLRGKQP